MAYLSLFEGFGIELEYMLVNEKTLDLMPISDILLREASGGTEYVSDFEDGDITWSNELVMHVIELKTTGPAKKLADLEISFLRSLERLRKIAKRHGAALLPTAMHPLMNPLEEVKLWPHDNNEVYAAYDRIFDCRGHGWSNLQSMHINLPFQTDEDFEKLHTAIRFLLPILPALSASSPMVEGKVTGHADNRLLAYQQNQKRVPSIAGQVVPDYASSMADYHERILAKIYRDIAPHDPDEILREDWLNSRGAISRFERQTIEIRVLDLQETPTADLAIAELICAVLKNLTGPSAKVAKANQQTPTTDSLKSVFDDCATHGGAAPLSKSYLALWQSSALTAADLWQEILGSVAASLTERHRITCQFILQRGTLAHRITMALGTAPRPEKVREVYARLCKCLETDRMFE